MSKNDEDTAASEDKKIDGQCAASKCKSTRVPNGEKKYLCPVHAPKQ